MNERAPDRIDLRWGFELESCLARASTLAADVQVADVSPATTKKWRGGTPFGVALPRVASEWHESRNDRGPQDVSAKSAYRAWWHCSTCGHDWVSPVHSRANGTGCPLCTNRVTVTGVNDLASIRPDLAAEWDPLLNTVDSPATIRISCTKVYWWRCKTCSASWQATVRNRVNGRSCSRCAGRVVWPGHTDLASQRPQLASEFHLERNAPLRADGICAASDKIVWWRCSVEGHEWQSSVANRRRGNGCPGCSGRAVVLGKNDLASQAPQLLLEWDVKKNLMPPHQVNMHSASKYWWRCRRCAYSWPAACCARVKGTGCPRCSKHGFHAAIPAVVYLVRNDELQAYKIGVSGVGSPRLQQLAARGWKTVLVEHFMTGVDARAVERSILRWWRQGLGIPVWLGKEEMGWIAGYTETANVDDIQQLEVVRRIRAASATVRNDVPDISRLPQTEMFRPS